MGIYKNRASAAKRLHHRKVTDFRSMDARARPMRDRMANCPEDIGTRPSENFGSAPATREVPGIA